MTALLQKAVAPVIALTTVGVMDVNFTELSYVFGELVDLVGDILMKMPTLVMYIAVIVIIVGIAGFATGLFGKVLSMIKIR